MSANDECTACPSKCPTCGAFRNPRASLDHRPLDNDDLHGVVTEIRSHVNHYATEPPHEGGSSLSPERKS